MLLMQRKKARRLHCVTVELLPLRMTLLAAFLVLGILAGYLLSGRCRAETGEELAGYLDRYLARAGQEALTWETVGQTLWCYFRASVCAFLLGFSPIGVAGLPLLCAAQGLVLSFSLFCFAGVLGREGFLALLALFGVRVCVVLPCTLLLSAAALERAYAMARMTLGGKRAQRLSAGGGYYVRFAFCCVCLFFGATAELWLVPRLLAAF